MRQPSLLSPTHFDHRGEPYRWSARVLTPLVLALATTACGTDSDDDGSSQASKLRLETPEYVLEPGTESQTCFYTSLGNTEDIFVTGFDATQSSLGHHVILFSPEEPKPDGTVEDCTDAEGMVDLRPLLLTLELNHFELEPGLAVRVPKNQQVVVQSHYINTTNEQVRVRDTLELTLTDPSPDLDPVAFWATSVLDLEIPPRSAHEIKYTCDAERDMNIFSLIGHMHDMGDQMTIRLGPPEAMELVYEINTWEPIYRDVPPVENFRRDAPLEVKAGDRIEVTCRWNSTSDEVLTFPAEMCASNAWVFPVDETMTCGGTVVGAPPGTLFGGTDECTGPADRGILDDPATDDAIRDCGLSCLSGGACSCLVDLGLTEGCAACYGDNIKCAAVNCISQCSSDSNSPECGACVTSNCDPGFGKCRGF